MSLSDVRLKDLSRLREERANQLVGYGIVSGLAGTGDSPRSKIASQSISNILKNMGIVLDSSDIRSRNVAAAMITASLPRYGQAGDFIDVNVTSMGDARSLLGGTLLMTPLKGADSKIYALAQGALSVGGYKYDLNGNVIQKNHPTAGVIPGGGTIERPAPESFGNPGPLEYVLFTPDITTVTRVVNVINSRFGDTVAKAVDPGRFKVSIPESHRHRKFEFLSLLELLEIEPDDRARLVVNERTGTVVSGGNVKISQTTITHGDLIVTITTDYSVSQPLSYLSSVSNGRIRTAVVPDTSVSVSEIGPMSVNLPSDSTVVELISALNQVRASSRDIITILQALKAAGALHAELIIQ